MKAILMKKTSLLHCCLVLLLGVACSKKEKLSESEIDLTTPKYGGTLIYAKNGPPITLDPALTRETESSVITGNIFEGLVEQKAGRVALDPGLAKSWVISEDGTTYTFHLRTGLTFHDGTPINADAVYINFERQRNKKHPYHKAKLEYEYWKNFDLDEIIRNIKVLDDSTIQFQLFKPDATFLNILSLSFMGIVSPAGLKKYGVDFSNNPVGSGPFRFVRWDPDGTVVLAAFENFWKGRPYIDTLIMKPVKNAGERWRMLKNGEIDMMANPQKSDIAEMDSTVGIKLIRQAGINVSYLAMNCSKKPFDDLRVRQAIVYAIDRDRLVREVFGEFGRPAKNPIPPVLLGFNEEIRFTPYDTTKSRQLLAEAGYPNGFKTSLWTMKIIRDYMPDGMKAAEIIQQDLKAVGIEAEIVAPEWQDFLKRRGQGEHELSISGWVGDAPDPHFFFYPLLDKTIAQRKPSTNAAFYTGQEMHELIIKGKQTTDPVERSSIYKKACEVFNRELPWFSIAHSLSIVPMRDYVIGFQLHSSAVRRFNTVWLAK